jgi:hypothetical protein
MRVFDRDLIRGGHYGQRSCEPHLKAEHMAAPTNAANVKKALANSEPSTLGTFLPRANAAACPQLAEGDIRVLNEESGFDPKRRWRLKTFAAQKDYSFLR